MSSFKLSVSLQFNRLFAPNFNYLINAILLMKKIINALLIAASVFTMTACFDITEEITRFFCHLD